MKMEQQSKSDWSEDSTDNRNFIIVYCKECGARIFDHNLTARFHIRIKCRKCNKVLLYVK